MNFIEEYKKKLVSADLPVKTAVFDQEESFFIHFLLESLHILCYDFLANAINCG